MNLEKRISRIENYLNREYVFKSDCIRFLNVISKLLESNPNNSQLLQFQSQFKFHIKRLDSKFINAIQALIERRDDWIYSSNKQIVEELNSAIEILLGYQNEN